MKASGLICTTVGTLAAIGMATTVPAQARHWGPGFVGGLAAGALIAGAASSAYAYAPGPGYAYDSYAYDGYGPGPRWDRRNRAYETYGVYDESQHGGQPSYVRPD
ncbi:hypothetical protein [Bradyrhizobium sp. 1]|uniref:hypothetical protein n=1 Tax=Bradyrhizobium sp. 1 TaxID=241591 RepID=UPI001FF98F3A|nr:hypothetical protein [Bradyrhizobium sp. 1]MCK1393682.1 hypothetical protein [Bradyrhizobium sp. 1]